MRKLMLLGIFLGIICAIGIFVSYHPALGRTPRADRLERIKMSPNYKNGEFQNINPTPVITSNKTFWQQMADFIFSKKSENIAPKEPVTAIKTDLHELDLSKDLFVWFGHSSYLFTNNGKTILVDPIFTSSFPANLTMNPFKGTDIYSPDDIPEIDYLVITHDHYDHLDYQTVKALKNRVKTVVCPLGVGEHLEYWGFDEKQIVEMDWNEVHTDNDGLKITCLPARHFSGRLIKRNLTLWASFMVQGKKTVYIGGDSGYDTHFAEIGERFKDIDLAMVENGQYNEDWKYIHLLPEHLKQAMLDLKAKTIQPVHNSKYTIAYHDWDEPIDNANKIEAENSNIHLLHAVIGKPMFY